MQQERTSNMATKAAKKVTTVVNGVPHTTTVKSSGSGSGSGDSMVAANQAAAAKLGISIPGVGGSSSTAPHSNGSWIDPIRAPGDTHARTGNNVENEDGTMSVVPGTSTLPGQDGTQPNPAIPTQVQNKISGAGVGNSSLSPINGLAPSPTPAAAPPSKYAGALAAAQAGGAAAPSDAGAARYAASSYIPENPADTSGVDTFLSADPGMTALMQGITQLLQPAKQTSSLMQDYDRLYKKSGLEKLNQEIIDADTIINGTRQDIENEVTSAGGMATDSQVEAMSLARNKSLLVRYNQLVQQKTDATNQLNTLSQLNQQDKQMAQQKVDSQINAMFKLADFRSQAQNNVREAYQSMVAKIGYQGVYQAYSQNPRQLAMLESSLGLGVGGLQNLASQRDLGREMQEAQLNTEYLQQSNIRSQIAERSAPSSGKALSSATALNLADSKAAVDMLTGLESAITKNGNLFGPIKGALGGINPYDTKSQDVQSTINATKQIVGKYLEGGVLRAEDEKKYSKILPTLRDTPQVAAAKLANVRTLVNSKINAQQQTLSASGYNSALGASDEGLYTAPDGSQWEIQ